MQTLSLFPALLDYQMLGVFLLRVTIGLILIHFWYEQSVRGKNAGRVAFIDSLGLRPAKLYSSILSTMEGLAGVLLVVGAYTQAVAIVVGVLMLIAGFTKWRNPSLTSFSPLSFYILFAVSSFALLFLGAGAFAVDMAL